jgi:hypothetical protein
MLAIFFVVLEMSGVVTRLAVCMRTMAERDCGWQSNYSDAVEAGTDSSTVQSGIAGEFLAKVLIVVVNAALACKPPICSRLFLLCHHPCITRGRRKDIIWKVETNFFSLCAM